MSTNAWVPNQHGAWAMLFLPITTGLITAAVIAPSYGNPVQWLALTFMPLAWIFGYFTFFAFGLWFKTRAPARRRAYLWPTLTYGALTAIFSAIVLYLQPRLLWWCVPFVPLIAVALMEVFRRRPRSLISGISTTVASALMYIVAVSASGFSILPWFFSEAPVAIWVTTLVIGLYFTGTIFYVKTIIRERDNAPFERVSLRYHRIALLITLITSIAAVIDGGYTASAPLMILVMAAAALRVKLIPPIAKANPREWTPKKVGMWEIPMCLILALGASLTLVV